MMKIQVQVVDGLVLVVQAQAQIVVVVGHRHGQALIHLPVILVVLQAGILEVVILAAVVVVIFKKETNKNDRINCKD